MIQNENIKLRLKKIKSFLYIAQLLKLFLRFFTSLKNRIELSLFRRDDKKLLKEMYPKVRSFYNLNLNLKNTGGFPGYYHGRNILGYTGMSFLEKDGENVGMSEGKIQSGNFYLPIVQLKTDLEVNFKKIFEQLRPKYVVDFGTNCGGSAVYFYKLIEEYSEPKVLTIDITNQAFNQYENFHNDFKTKDKIQTILNKSTLDCVAEVKEFLKDRKEGERVLFSYDDDHSYEHTYKELLSYAPLLLKGDYILMQDTWNQGLFTHETSPMLSIFKYLKEHNDFALDEEFCRQMVLPCNFIYGLIYKK